MSTSQVYEIKYHGDFPVVAIKVKDFMGEELSKTIKKVFEELFSKQERYVIVDLSQVSYIDSSGLSALLLGHRLCRDAGGAFVVAGATGWVERIIMISELHRVLNMVSNVKQAVEYLILTKLQQEIEDEPQTETE